MVGDHVEPGKSDALPSPRTPAMYRSNTRGPARQVTKEVMLEFTELAEAWRDFVRAYNRLR